MEKGRLNVMVLRVVRVIISGSPSYQSIGCAPLLRTIDHSLVQVRCASSPYAKQRPTRRAKVGSVIKLAAASQPAGCEGVGSSTSKAFPGAGTSIVSSGVGFGKVAFSRTILVRVTRSVRKRRLPDRFPLTIDVSEMSIEPTETVVTDNRSLFREWSTSATAVS